MGQAHNSFYCPFGSSPVASPFRKRFLILLPIITALTSMSLTECHFARYRMRSSQQQTILSRRDWHPATWLCLAERTKWSSDRAFACLCLCSNGSSNRIRDSSLVGRALCQTAVEKRNAFELEGAKPPGCSFRVEVNFYWVSCKSHSTISLVGQSWKPQRMVSIRLFILSIIMCNNWVSLVTVFVYSTGIEPKASHILVVHSLLSYSLSLKFPFEER